jgi:hypothetical protein
MRKQRYAAFRPMRGAGVSMQKSKSACKCPNKSHFVLQSRFTITPCAWDPRFTSWCGMPRNCRVGGGPPDRPICASVCGLDDLDALSRAQREHATQPRRAGNKMRVSRLDTHVVDTAQSGRD